MFRLGNRYRPDSSVAPAVCAVCTAQSYVQAVHCAAWGAGPYLHLTEAPPCRLYILFALRQVAMHTANQDTELLVASSRPEAGVAVVELNRATKRNALSQSLINQLLQTLRDLDRDVQVRAIVLTSAGQSPFCGMSSFQFHRYSRIMLRVAGADIQELANISTADAYRIGWLKDLEIGFSTLRTPVIAAVRGYAVSDCLA